MLREIESAEYIAGHRLVKEQGIKFGLFTEDGNIWDYYPYWHNWITFTLEAGVPILSNIHHGDTALYTPLDFPTGLTQFCVTLRGKASGRLSVRTGSSDGPILAEVSLSNANERWTGLRTAIQFQPAGRFGLYLCFEGGSSHTLCEISRFRFI